MAPNICEDPNSTGYAMFKNGMDDIVYVITNVHSELIEIVKEVKPSYPQARKNKRDNFKSR